MQNNYLPGKPRKTTTSGRSKLRKRFWQFSLLLIIGCGAYAFWPRHANLRDFSVETSAKQEAQAWRHYYEKNYLSLGADLYVLCRKQMGVSPARSVQIVWHAVRAAQIFQRSQNREAAMAALPDLQKYYCIISRTSGETFDTKRAAELEIEWWQQRREHVPPEAYAKTIADCAAIIYSTQNADIEQASFLRAQAMAYRDARRDGQMTEADWQHIENELRRAYTHLLKGVAEATHDQ